MTQRTAVPGGQALRSVRRAIVSVFVLAPLVGVAATAPEAHASVVAPSAQQRGALESADTAQKILLVDDDESDNNNIPGDTRLSHSDVFFRKALKQLGRAFDVAVVSFKQSGPKFAALRPYSVVIWYTGASYGGNPDNSSVISLDDEKTIQKYLAESGGTVIVVSPGYMTNALGANGAAHWGGMTAEFLTKIMGVKGGRGMLGRFDAGEVKSSNGETFTVTKQPAVETQFSALNPSSATTLFTSPLVPDGAEKRATAVAVSNRVGEGRFVYVGFTLENVVPGGDKVLDIVLSGSATVAAAAPGFKRAVRTEVLTVAGLGSRIVRTEPLTVAGMGARVVRTEPLTVAGIGSRTVRTEALSVTGFTSRAVRTEMISVTGAANP